MPFVRKRPSLQLTKNDRNKLQLIASSRKKEMNRVLKARILLAYADEESINSIAKRFNVSRALVERCIDKAVRGGIEMALSELSRSGRPPLITADDKAWVINIACTKPKEHGYPHETWTISLLSKHVRQNAVKAGHPALVRSGKSAIHNFLHESEVRPHKVSYYLEQRDPEFEEKMAQVLVFYKEVQLINEQEKSGAVSDRKWSAISYDEKPGIQAIENTSHDLPPVPGKHPHISRDYEYRRHGTLSLLAGIDLHDGHIIGLVRDRHRSSEFIEFLEEVDSHYPLDWKLKIILDNHSAHISNETMQWLKNHPNRFEFIFTPKHGSWLNLVETFFSKMTRSFLRHMRVKSKAELKERIERYLKGLNDEPVVFRWKYRMDELI